MEQNSKNMEQVFIHNMFINYQNAVPQRKKIKKFY